MKEKAVPALDDSTSAPSAYYLDTNYYGAALTKVKSPVLDQQNSPVAKMTHLVFKLFENLSSPVKGLIFALNKLLSISPIKLIRFVTGVELLCTAKGYALYPLRNIVACHENT